MYKRQVKKDRPAPEHRSVTRKSIAGAELGTVALEPTIFGIVPNLSLIHIYHVPSSDGSSSPSFDDARHSLAH